MLDELELKLIKRLNYIPDSLLEGYLEGKLLVKPNYPSTVGPIEVASRYHEALDNMKKNQAARNNATKPKRR